MLITEKKENRWKRKRRKIKDLDRDLIHKDTTKRSIRIEANLVQTKDARGTSRKSIIEIGAVQTRKDIDD